MITMARDRTKDEEERIGRSLERDRTFGYEARHGSWDPRSLRTQPGMGRCEIHKVYFALATSPTCPVCIFDAGQEAMMAEARALPKPTSYPRTNPKAKTKVFPYRCRVCSGRTTNDEGVCSRYACRKTAGLVSQQQIYECKYCGHRTRFQDLVCSKYECRKADIQAVKENIQNEA